MYMTGMTDGVRCYPGISQKAGMWENCGSAKHGTIRIAGFVHDTIIGENNI